MGIAVAALHFCADHAVRGVGFFLNRLIFKRSGKAGPAAAGMEFCFGAEQWMAATDALVGAGGVGRFVLTRERGLGAFLAGDMKLIWSKLSLPFAIGLLDFFAHVSS